MQIIIRTFSVRLWLIAGAAILLSASVLIAAVRTNPTRQENTEKRRSPINRLLERGRYLAQIGACEACHTPPDVPKEPPNSGPEVDRERQFRTDPDWYKYLDLPEKKNQGAGGVPFWLRFSSNSNGFVASRNITPDNDTGLGTWTEEQIIEVIRTGKRKDGSVLFLFPPHSFFSNMAYDDARALAVYLKSLRPIRNEIPPRILPFPPQPAQNVTALKRGPTGRSLERGRYLVGALVGCRECHSHTEGNSLKEFTGGDPTDPFLGVFRLGPDLPLRSTERALAAFPYPGYAVLYAPNLTRFGQGGDLHHLPIAKLVTAIRHGIAPTPDDYGRPDPIAYVMLWQFYRDMSYDDAYSIALYIRGLKYVKHPTEPNLRLFGTDWEAAFKQVFNEPPSDKDRVLFGKNH